MEDVNRALRTENSKSHALKIENVQQKKWKTSGRKQEPVFVAHL